MCDENKVSLSKLITLESDLVSQRNRIISEYEKSMSEIDKDLLKVRQQKSLKAADFNLDKINLAESVITIRGSASKVVGDSNSRSEAVKSAIEDIASAGSESIMKSFFGVKNYSGFGDQGSDHPYGICPRNGSIVFSVGLKESIRKRVPFLLTEEEKEAAIYYLLNIKKIQSEKDMVSL